MFDKPWFTLGLICGILFSSVINLYAIQHNNSSNYFAQYTGSIERAEYYRDKGDLQRAYEYYTEAVQLSSRNFIKNNTHSEDFVSAMIGASKCLESMERYDEAAKAFYLLGNSMQSLGMPKDLIIMNTSSLAYNLYMSGEVQEAAKLWKKTIAAMRGSKIFNSSCKWAYVDTLYKYAAALEESDSGTSEEVAQLRARAIKLQGGD